MEATVTGADLRKKLLTNIVWVILVILVGFSLGPILEIATGCSSMYVKGVSMLPNLREGDYVLIKDVDLHEIVIGDIIVIDKYVKNPGDTEVRMRYPNPPWIHRVIETYEYQDELYFKTKGDNNVIEDSGWTPKEGVQGKLIFSIPLLGFIFVNPVFRTINVLLIIFLVFLIFYTEVKDSLKGSKKAGSLIVSLRPFFVLLLIQQICTQKG